MYPLVNETNLVHQVDFIYNCIYVTLGTCVNTGAKCHINRVVPPDDGPGDVRNM